MGETPGLAFSETQADPADYLPDEDPIVFTIEMKMSGALTYVCQDGQEHAVPGALRAIAEALEQGDLADAPGPEKDG